MCTSVSPVSKFGGYNDTDLVFTKQGFNNWKTMLEKGNRFSKHESSEYH